MVKEAEALGRLISSREKITRVRRGGDMGVQRLWLRSRVGGLGCCSGIDRQESNQR